MPRSTIFDSYQEAYFKAASLVFFREYNPTLSAGTFVYTSNPAVGNQGATIGEKDVSKYSHRELYYQPRALVSGSITLSIQGRPLGFGTHTQLKRFSLTAVQATWPSATKIDYKGVDYIRVGVRAASPAALDSITVLGLFK